MIVRFDGLDQLIMYGTKCPIGHTAMVLEFDNELYVIESTDINPVSYESYQQIIWSIQPKQSGIIKTPLEEWLAISKSKSKLVSLIKLSKDVKHNLV